MSREHRFASGSTGGTPGVTCETFTQGTWTELRVTTHRIGPSGDAPRDHVELSLDHIRAPTHTRGGVRKTIYMDLNRTQAIAVRDALLEAYPP